jgi:hypothetical protein
MSGKIVSSASERKTLVEADQWHPRLPADARSGTGWKELPDIDPER